jgi:archaellum component FlaC
VEGIEVMIMATIVGLHLIGTNLPSYDDYLMGLGKTLAETLPKVEELEHRVLTQQVIIEPLSQEEIQELHEEYHRFGIDNEQFLY